MLVLVTLEYNEIGIGHVMGEKPFIFDMGNSDFMQLCYNDYTSYDFYSYYDTVCSNGNKIPSEIYESTNFRVKSNNPIVVVFPYSNQLDVLPRFYGETPDPLPNISKPTGNPISIQFNDYYIKNISLIYFELYRDDDTKVENTKLLTSQTDPNKKFSKYEYALYSINPLKDNSWYRVSASFIINEELWEKSWKFKTTVSRW